MVIDTSAAIAILLQEPEAEEFIKAIATDSVRLMSSAIALETAIVIEARKGPAGGREFDLLVHKAGIAIVPLQADHVEEARIAWREFGKGNHPAGLNFCDCCAYALSRVSGEPLLFKGQDFLQTNVLPAIRRQSKERIMKIELQRTYYRQGFFNVPVEYDRYFGPDRGKIEILVEGEAEPIQGIISRTAQRNGTARVLGRHALRDHFRSRCQAGDTLLIAIESPRRIRILSPLSRG